MARNQIIDLTTEPLTELMSTEPSKRTEIIKDLSSLQSTKIQNNGADIEKIKNILMKIIKEDVAEQQPTGAVATAKTVKGIRSALPDKTQSELTADDATAAMAAYVGTVIPMDKSTSTLFQLLAKQMLKQPTENEE